MIESPELNPLVGLPSTCSFRVIDERKIMPEGLLIMTRHSSILRAENNTAILTLLQVMRFRKLSFLEIVFLIY